MKFSGLNNLSIGTQARAVLEYLDGMQLEIPDDDVYLFSRLRAAAWYNGRETGFSVTFRPSGQGQTLIICCFEHRNSDRICALRAETDKIGINPPTIESPGDVLYPTNNKYDDIAYGVDYGEAGKIGYDLGVVDTLKAITASLDKAMVGE